MLLNLQWSYTMIDSVENIIALKMYLINLSYQTAQLSLAYLKNVLRTLT